MIPELLIKEFKNEVATTKAMLSLVPADKLDYKPHVKSMSMGKLAEHIAQICGWPNFCLEVEEVDFAKTPPQSADAKTGAEFVAIAEAGANQSIEGLSKIEDDYLLNKKWVMKYNDVVVMDFTKYEAVRHSFDQMIHHRAQLGVYLRLLDIPIPGSYGPSADTMQGL